jgi:hypothetical protein
LNSNEEKGARLSECRRYRYRLWRTWDKALPPVVFIMLNPSLADEERDDRTVAGCVERAKRLGAGGIVVMNLFAWITPYRDELYDVEDPVGPDTDAEVIDACRGALHVICAWGNTGRHRSRGAQMLALLRENGVRPVAVKVNKNGTPGHPLYVAHDAALIPLA